MYIDGKILRLSCARGYFDAWFLLWNLDMLSDEWHWWIMVPEWQCMFKLSYLTSELMIPSNKLRKVIIKIGVGVIHKWRHQLRGICQKVTLLHKPTGWKWGQRGQKSQKMGGIIYGWPLRNKGKGFHDCESV